MGVIYVHPVKVIFHSCSTVIQRNVDHGVFVRDLARTSEYFCEKAIINGFVEDILSKMCIYNQRLLYSVSKSMSAV